MDIGGELRRARKARSRSIEEISRATKISPSVLRAIESNEFESVPGGLFTRGFLRAFAREVGLDGEEIVRRYRAEFEPRETPPDAERPDSAAPSDSDVPLDTDDEWRRSRRTQIIQVAVIVMVVLVYFGALRLPKTLANTDLKSTEAIGGPSATAMPAGTATPAGAPTAAATATSGAAAARAAATPAEVPVATTGRLDHARGELKLEIRPQGLCWVEAIADGQRIVARLMNAGDRQPLNVREDLTLIVGDPATFAFSIDGIPGRSLGRAGVATRVHINPRNYLTFLEPQR
jgi:cytoskeletal protein RodZ